MQSLLICLNLFNLLNLTNASIAPFASWKLCCCIVMQKDYDGPLTGKHVFNIYNSKWWICCYLSLLNCSVHQESKNVRMDLDMKPTFVPFEHFGFYNELTPHFHAFIFRSMSVQTQLNLSSCFSHIHWVYILTLGVRYSSVSFWIWMFTLHLTWFYIEQVLFTCTFKPKHFHWLEAIYKIDR